MGGFVSVKCRNKSCKYHVMLRVGVGVQGLREAEVMEQRILNGEVEASDKIKSLLQSGEHLESNAIYLCPKCREWVTDNTYFVFEPIHVSPYGTIRKYKVHYLDKEPLCKECGSLLEYILSPFSSKTPCPKCGSDNMISRDKGSFI